MSYFKDNKASVVALVIAILAFGLAFFGGGTNTIKEITREVSLSGSTGFDQFQFQSEDGSVNGGTVDYIQLTMAVATDTAFIRNVSDNGASIWLSDAALSSGGTASSSFRTYFLATSTPYVLDTLNYTNLVNTGGSNATKILVKQILATSTTATTTSSVMTAVLGNGEGLIEIPYLWFRQPSLPCLLICMQGDSK